jgi:hypothetical protein
MLTPTTLVLALLTQLAFPETPRPLAAAVPRAIAALEARHGAAERARIERGVRQAASLWRESDGDARAFEAFALAQFAPGGVPLDTLFGRLEATLEQLDGHANEVERALSWWTQIDTGPMQPVDSLLATYDAAAHQLDDLFGTKVAFATLLNFPLTTLDERVAGGGWTRRQWAEARLASRFDRRVPAKVSQGLATASAHADQYVSDYNVYAHHLLDATGGRPFEKGKRLLSHWNLRDELKAQYAQEGGLARQRLLAKVMERIVTQTIPAAVVNDPTVDWDPASNRVTAAPPEEIEGGAAPRTKVDGAREPDTRYAMLLQTFRAAKAADPYSPAAPTLMARRFDLGRELPEARVVALLTQVLEAPEVKQVAALIRQRLGRPLEAQDIWYDGFRPRTRFTEADLDQRTKARFPSAAAFAKDLPSILAALGFTPEKAAWLAERIDVDPARGSGHAAGAARRGDKARLRTRVGPDGMDYKGFNIAVHELGHNVEQTFSLYEVDSTLLEGVPNTAFTEAIAFVFQARDLTVLGLGAPDAEATRLLALNDLWMTWEISGVALVDVGVWRWMYQHPAATPAETREATLRIAREVWNRWYAPVLGVKDSPLLAIYSHMIHSFLYLPDYPLGHLISAQIEAHLSSRPPDQLGAEVERMTRVGRVAPDVWMRLATGAPVSAEPLLQGTRRALEAGPR